MPRIYAPNEAHDMAWGAVDFSYGVSAVGVAVDTGYFTDKGYTVDQSKNVLSPFDMYSREALEDLANYLGLTFTAETTKQELVRLVEGYVSTANITALTVTSVAGTAVGDSKITSTGAVGTEGNTFAYKTGTDVFAPLFRDNANGYTAFTDGADITPGATHTKITVVELNTAGEIVSLGTATLTVKQ